MNYIHLLIVHSLIFTLVKSAPLISIDNDDSGLASIDCQIRCPHESERSQLVLPALSQRINASGHAENTLECWRIDTITTKLPGIDNAFRLDWEGGFDAAYQYIFTGPSFMPSHPAPEPSLIVMANGIGKLGSLLSRFWIFDDT